MSEELLDIEIEKYELNTSDGRKSLLLDLQEGWPAPDKMMPKEGQRDIDGNPLPRKWYKKSKTVCIAVHVYEEEKEVEP